jgi:hypothetical protein
VGADGVAEDPGPGAGLAGGAAQRRGLGALGDVLALAQHRPDERHDRLDGGLRRGGDRLGSLAGSDPGLDLAGAEGARHLFLQRSRSGGLAAECSAQSRGDRDGELLALPTHEEEAPAVGADSCEIELRHAPSFRTRGRARRAPG